MADRSLLRLSATLVVIGEVLFAIVTLFHADGPANNHPVVFAEYARSASWIAVHFGQFVFMAVLLLGLFVLFFALNVRSGALGWVGRFAAGSVVVALRFTASFRPWMGSPLSTRLMRGRTHRRRRRQHALPVLRR
jgi:hypothetical protein